jgi:hypothetical protein
MAQPIPQPRPEDDEPWMTLENQPGAEQSVLDHVGMNLGFDQVARLIIDGVDAEEAVKIVMKQIKEEDPSSAE